MIYTGIGSRETPENVLIVMTAMATILADDGHLLRSGGAPGADMAFERGADAVEGEKEIYLPWSSFNAEEREKTRPDGVTFYVSEAAQDHAARYHPAWGRLSHGAHKLMGRNSYQVLGIDLDTPTDLVLCWTKNGKHGGGTGQAIRIAIDLEIPVIDFGGYDDLADAVDYTGHMIELLTSITL